MKKKLAICDPPTPANSEIVTTTSTTEQDTVQLGNHEGEIGIYRRLYISINGNHNAGHLEFDETIGVPQRLLATYRTNPTNQNFRLPVYQHLADLSQRYSRNNSRRLPPVDTTPRNVDILLPSGPFATYFIATTGVLRVESVTRDGAATNQFNIVGYLTFYPHNQQEHGIFVRVSIDIALDEEDRTTSFFMRRAADDEQQEIGDFQLTLRDVDETTRTSARVRRVMESSMRVPLMVPDSESEPQNSTSSRNVIIAGALWFMAFLQKRRE